MKTISQVQVDKVSLITDDKKPAVEKAETRNAIFKYSFFKKESLSDENLTKAFQSLIQKIADVFVGSEKKELSSIEKSLNASLQKLEDGDYLDTQLNSDDGYNALDRKKKKRDNQKS